MKHVITAYVQNQPGVLARIVSLISGRGFNIESLNVAPTLNPEISRMTMTVPGDDKVLEQVGKQLKRLIDVISVTDLTQKHYLSRELALVEVVAAGDGERSEVKRIAAMFEAKVVSAQPGSLTIQMVGEKESINELVTTLGSFKVLDVSRSGVIAVARGRRRQ